MSNRIDARAAARADARARATAEAKNIKDEKQAKDAAITAKKQSSQTNDEILTQCLKYLDQLENKLTKELFDAYANKIKSLTDFNVKALSLTLGEVKTTDSNRILSVIDEYDQIQRMADVHDEKYRQSRSREKQGKKELDEMQETISTALTKLNAIAIGTAASVFRLRAPKDIENFRESCYALESWALSFVVMPDTKHMLDPSKARTPILRQIFSASWSGVTTGFDMLNSATTTLAAIMTAPPQATETVSPLLTAPTPLLLHDIKTPATNRVCVFLDEKNNNNPTHRSKQ